QLRPGRHERPLQHIEARRPSGAHDQTGREGRTAEDERIAGHGQPPWTAVRTSTRSPSERGVVDHCARGTTVSLRAAATPEGAAVSEVTTRSRAVPGGYSQGSPLTEMFIRAAP